MRVGRLENDASFSGRADGAASRATMICRKTTSSRWRATWEPKTRRKLTSMPRRSISGRDGSQRSKKGTRKQQPMCASKGCLTACIWTGCISRDSTMNGTPPKMEPRALHTTRAIWTTCAEQPRGSLIPWNTPGTRQCAATRHRRRRWQRPRFLLPAPALPRMHRALWLAWHGRANSGYGAALRAGGVPRSPAPRACCVHSAGADAAIWPGSVQVGFSAKTGSFRAQPGGSFRAPPPAGSFRMALPSTASFRGDLPGPPPRRLQQPLPAPSGELIRPPPPLAPPALLGAPRRGQLKTYRLRDGTPVTLPEHGSPPRSRPAGQGADWGAEAFAGPGAGPAAPIRQDYRGRGAVAQPAWSGTWSGPSAQRAESPLRPMRLRDGSTVMLPERGSLSGRATPLQLSVQPSGVALRTEPGLGGTRRPALFEGTDSLAPPEGSWAAHFLSRRAEEYTSV